MTCIDEEKRPWDNKYLAHLSLELYLGKFRKKHSDDWLFLFSELFFFNFINIHRATGRADQLFQELIARGHLK